MKITKVLKTEAKNGNVDEQEVVFILDNFIQISGITVRFKDGEFVGATWPENIKFLDTEDELRVTTDLAYKLSTLMQAAPEAFEERKNIDFGKYVERYEKDILNKKYSE